MLQSYVDSAALMGAGELRADQTAATTERTKTFAEQQAGNLPLRWTVTTSAEANATLGSVSVTQDAVRPSFFGSLLPPGGFRLKATATATNSARMPLCVLALRTAGSEVTSLAGNATLMASSCLVQSNSDVSAVGASRVQAGAVNTAGAATGTISPTPVTDVAPRPDPFLSLPITVPNTCTDYNASISAGTFAVNPGVHCGNIDVSGSAVIVLNPGEHYFVGGTLAMRGNAQVSATDAVLIFKGQTSVQFSGNATLSIEGRKTGAYAGFAMVGDRSFTGEVRFSTPNARKLHGTIYLPNADLTVTGPGTRAGDESKWTIIVAKEIDVSGGAALTINSDYVSAVPVPNGAGPKIGTGTRLQN